MKRHNGEASGGLRWCFCCVYLDQGDKMKTQTLYAVGAVKREITVQILGVEQKMPLNWIDGMVGTIPIFERWVDADKYAGDKFQVYEIKISKCI